MRRGDLVPRAAPAEARGAPAASAVPATVPLVHAALFPRVLPTASCGPSGPRSAAGYWLPRNTPWSRTRNPRPACPGHAPHAFRRVAHERHSLPRLPLRFHVGHHDARRPPLARYPLHSSDCPRSGHDSPAAASRLNGDAADGTAHALRNAAGMRRAPGHRADGKRRGTGPLQGKSRSRRPRLLCGAKADKPPSSKEWATPIPTNR